MGKTLNDKKLTRKGLAIFQKILNQFAPYVLYQTELTNRFINPSMTYESRLTIYQLYRAIELYESYGGTAKEVESILKKHGLRRDVLKQYYDYYMGAATPGEEDLTSESPEEAATELAKYCEIANELAGRSPQDYADASNEEKYIDSLLWMVLDQVKDDPQIMALLDKSPQYQKLDKARSQRVWDEFKRDHPEYAR